MKVGYNISGLIMFASGPEWRAQLGRVFADHLGPAMVEFDLDRKGIARAIGERWTTLLWGWVFEDLASRKIELTGRNLVDDYLEHRGWTETEAAKAYMAALKIAETSLYEVSSVEPGSSFLLRDLIHGGDPVLVNERRASTSLKQWDRIGGRILLVRGEKILAGGVLSFTRNASERLLNAARNSNPILSVGAAPQNIDYRQLTLAVLISTAWLFDVLSQAADHVAASTCQNRDGDQLLLHRVYFAIAIGASHDEIAERLNAALDLRPANPKTWNWLDRRSKVQSHDEFALDTPAPGRLLDSGLSLLGRVELSDSNVILSANSVKRASDGTVFIGDILKGLLGTPLTSVQTVNQAIASYRDQNLNATPVSTSAASTLLVHEILDRHYRDTLDKPVPVLGNITPRTAVKTTEGRLLVAEWLKYIENSARKQADPKDPMITYNFEWIWLELNIEKLRC